MTPNTEERLTAELDSVMNRYEEHGLGNRPETMWFRLAAVAVHCLVLIAAALWDKGATR